MKQDRREFLRTVGKVALLVAAGAGLFSAFTPLDALAQAKPDAVDPVELLKPPELGDRALGQENAPVTIVEYASMTCPHCAAFHKNIYPAIKQKYVDTGKVRFIFREFPLDPRALGASMLARCAEPEKFFPFIDILFQKQADWAGANDPAKELLKLAKFAGMGTESYNKCMSNEDLARDILKVKDNGYSKFKVNATPTIFINGVRAQGWSNVEDFEKLLKQQLEG